MSRSPSRSRPSSGHDQRTRPPAGCCLFCWYHEGASVPAPAYETRQGDRIVGVRYCAAHRAPLRSAVGPLAGPDTPPYDPLRRKPRGACHRCYFAGRPGVLGEAYDQVAPIATAGWRLCYPCLLEEESEGNQFRPAKRRRTR